MIKLSHILNEIRVNPVKTSQQAFEELYKFSPFLCEDMDIMEDESIDDILSDHDFESSKHEQAKLLCENYKNFVKKDDVWFYIFEDGDSKIHTLPKVYKYLNIDYINDGYNTIILHNWPNLKI